MRKTMNLIIVFIMVSFIAEGAFSFKSITDTINDVSGVIEVVKVEPVKEEKVVIAEPVIEKEEKVVIVEPVKEEKVVKVEPVKKSHNKKLTKAFYKFPVEPDLFELLMASNYGNEYGSVKYTFTDLTVNGKSIDASNTVYKYEYTIGTKAVVKYTVNVYKKNNYGEIYISNQYTATTIFNYANTAEYIDATGDTTLKGRLYWILNI